MPRRIDIELTSSRPDGSWTWRASGAREPRGVVDASVLPGQPKVGDEFKVEVEQEIDGITVLSVVHGRQKVDKEAVLELLPSEQPFEPVIQQRAERDRTDTGDRRGGKRPERPRRDGDGGDRPKRPDRTARGPRGDRRPERAARGERTDRTDRGEHRESRPERTRPHFTPPPELPQRPKPKRLRPGKANRTAVLDALPEEQRPIAELAIQGLAAVRQRLRDDNQKLTAEGKAPMPEGSVLKMAEELLPRLRVAEWLDRAEAARGQIEHLDLRDLRSVVASSDDPMVARDETTRQLAGELKTALATKQEQELQLWFGDIDAALRVGRVIRALRLSSQPPKAGVVFPTELAQRLTDGANASLTPTDGAERWCAVLEAAAFSPIRTHVAPSGVPATVADELRQTVTRLAPALPQVAAMFGIEPAANASMPKPLRPTARPKPTKPRKAVDPAPAAKPRRERAVEVQEPAAASSSPPAAPDADHSDQAEPSADETTTPE
ncbi:MAG TPA: hypothetical protein VNO51_00760, partial [Ilumatobacteraceae bacterium]|nr:hypothetical protein [Ilumatobacteraceae bacterium]